MKSKDIKPETLQAFKDSFSYGSRTDLSFKFIAKLSEEEAAKFLQELLWKLGDSFSDGNLERIIDHTYEWQCRGYAGRGTWNYDEGPFAPLNKPISQTRIGLIASSGHFVEGDDPQPFGIKDMTQEEAAARIQEFLRAAPTLSAVPFAIPRENLRVRHGGYDIRGAQADPNVTLPLERLRELREEGLIGELAPYAYSFVGACAQTRLLNHTGPEWVAMFQQEQIEAAIMVPV
jgi:D-proline reductase (dithiol) PrdB